MTTERQSESARINGAKSHGPISAEGKEKSSRNSLRHGCTASHTLLLACEDPGDLDRMLEKYNAMYKPTTLEEHDLVAEMCSARWPTSPTPWICLRATNPACVAFISRPTPCFCGCGRNASPNRPRPSRHPRRRPLRISPLLTMPRRSARPPLPPRHPRL